jgi:tetratricopeptide (TPR) repeat protein
MVFKTTPLSLAMTTLVEQFALAVQHHRAGNLGLAEQLYQQILRADGYHADAHHLLGVIAYQEGRYDRAILSIRQAIDLNAAAAVYHTNLGLAYEASGQIDKAVGAYQKAIGVDPNAAEAHNNLGNALVQLGKLPEAVIHCRQALVCRPEFPEAHNNLGNALLEQGHLDEAVLNFRQALRINPNFAKAANNLGNALRRQGNVDEAIHSYQEAVRLNPQYAEAFYNWGIVLEEQDQVDKAIRCFQEAIRLNPRFADAYNNMGIGLQHQDRIEEATRCYQQALQLKPQYAEALTNLGNIHWQQGCLDEALGCYEQVLDSRPDMAEPHFNRARLWLLKGDWNRGWKEYEWRWQSAGFSSPSFQQPRWDGAALKGQTILLFAEQGLGDTLHFIRYVPLVKECGGRIVFQCQAPLHRLLKDFPGIDELIAQGSPLPAFDVQAPLLSLPGIFGTTPANVPRAIPYLHADSDLVDHWRSELFKSEIKTTDIAPPFKVGIAWQGNPGFIGDHRRSIALTEFAPLARVKGVELLSLQKGPGADQVRGLGDRFSVRDLGSSVDEASGAFMDSAAIMRNLDLIITSDSAVAHLAGALGVPVWVALPGVPDWRWLLEREDSPWYPSMRLFRQTRQGRWDNVFERIAEELQKVSHR